MSAGDVYTYSPKEHHCIEGIAVENDRGDLIDWFWTGEVISHRQYVSRDAEDLTKIANLGDYDPTPLDGRESNKDYAPEDRLTLHAQHGLQRTYYVRKGAVPDLATMIENARKALEEAESKARSAQRRVEWAQEKLDQLLAAS